VQAPTICTIGKLEIYGSGLNSVWSYGYRARPSYPTVALDFIRKNVATGGLLQIAEFVVLLALVLAYDSCKQESLPELEYSLVHCSPIQVGKLESKK